MMKFERFAGAPVSGLSGPGGGGGDAGRLGADLPALAAIATRRMAGGSRSKAAWAASRAPRAGRRSGEWVLEQFRHPLLGFTAKHFHDQLVAGPRLQAQLQLGADHLAARMGGAAAPRRGAHRRKRPRRPLPGMMLHQDGSRHEWLAGQAARPDRHHGRRHQRNLFGLPGRRRGHDVQLPGAEAGDRGATRAVLLASTPTGPATTGTRPRQAARWPRTTHPGRPRASSARHRADRGLFARGQRALRAHAFGTLQKRLPRNWLAGIATEAADRFIKEVYLPDNKRPLRAPAEVEGSAFVPFEHPGALDDILCVQEERTVANDNTVRYKARPPADPRRPPSPPLRQGQGPGPRVSRRHARRLPRAPMPRPLQGQRRAHRNPTRQAA